MLSRALAHTVRLRPRASLRPAPVRTLAANPFVVADDRLTRLLDGDGGGGSTSTNTAALWGTGTPDDDASPPSPPRAPAGSLPTPARPKARTLESHALPLTRLFHLHVLATRNNTILTFTDPAGSPCAWVSAGLCGFKKVQRSGYEAGYQCAVRMFARIARAMDESPTPLQLEIAFKGFGQGREAVYRALMGNEGDKIRSAVHRFKDATPIKIGGTRARKTRRL